MSNKPSLPFVVTNAHLTSAQQEEFDDVLKLYNDSYKYLLQVWFDYHAGKPLNHIGGSDRAFINRRITSWLHLNKHTEESVWQIGMSASQNLLAYVTNMWENGLCIPQDAVTATSIHYNQGVEIRPKDQFARLPIVGRIRFGRFQYFSGRRKGFDLRKNSDGSYSIVLYYEPRQSRGLPGDIEEGSDDAAKYRMNKRLQAAKIGLII